MFFSIKHHATFTHDQCIRPDSEPYCLKNHYSKQECCCVLVLYYPEPDITLKIKQYSLLFPFLCVVDNSPGNFLGNSLKPGFSEETVLFIHNANIGGIARALNLGVVEAIKRRFDWIMTLDQDSELTDGMLDDMWETWLENKHEKIAIISPYQMLETENSLGDMPDYEFSLVVMTSGNLLNVEAYKVVGPFDEQLIIDYVDHDFCLRLQQKGYRIIRANKAVLKHKLGKGELVRFMGRLEYVSNHPPLRRYYITRNRLYVAFKYWHLFPSYFRREIRLLFRDVFMLLLFEEQKVEKIVMMLRGFKDYFTNRLGMLHHVEKGKTKNSRCV